MSRKENPERPARDMSKTLPPILTIDEYSAFNAEKMAFIRDRAPNPVKVAYLSTDERGRLVGGTWTGDLLISCELPFRLTSPNLARRDGHWGKRSRRSKPERQGTFYGLMAKTRVKPVPPLRVVITRVGWGQMDSDNLPGAAKAVRDGVADFLGINDRHDHLVSYEYAQERSKAWGVRVEIFRRAP